jgi:hypothetical protein
MLSRAARHPTTRAQCRRDSTVSNRPGYTFGYTPADHRRGRCPPASSMPEIDTIIESKDPSYTPRGAYPD